MYPLIGLGMSNNLDITIYDFEHICRTCLSREDLKPFYEKCFSSTCLLDMLMCCTIVKFTEDDGLPAKICTNCINEINQAISFAQRCETTDTILRECVKKFKTELENNSSQSFETIMEEKVEMKIEIKPEIVLSNIPLKTVRDVLKNYEYVKVKQEYKEPAEGVKQEIEYVGLKQEEELIIENECNENYEDETDFQITEESSKDENGSPPAKKIRKSKPKPAYYECLKCLEKFPDFTGLKKHREEVKHPPNAAISCRVCKKMIVYGSMKRHIRTHTGEKPYSCDICGGSFCQAGTLSRHKRAVHLQLNDRTHKCQTCDKSFKNRDSLNAHQRRERKASRTNQILNRDFQCTECDRSFTTKGLLQRHSLIHGEKKLFCSVCERGFTTKDSLNSHSKIHTGVRPYTCLVCEKTFSKLGYLKNHKRIHTGEKPNVCSVCSKAFIQPNSLKYHMRTHTGEKPYSCGVCGKSFCTKNEWTIHTRMHTGEKPYMCPFCGKRFHDSSAMNRHKRGHSKPNVVL